MVSELTKFPAGLNGAVVGKVYSVFSLPVAGVNLNGVRAVLRGTPRRGGPSLVQGQSPGLPYGKI